MDAAEKPIRIKYTPDFGRVPGDGANGYIFEKLIRGNYISGMTVMVPTECLGTQRFDPNMTVGEDWDLWVRLARTVPFRYIPESLYGYRVYSGNTDKKSDYEVANLRNQAVMYEHWLRVFDDLGRADKDSIIRSLWKCYLGQGSKRSLLWLALRHDVAARLFLSRAVAALSYRLRLRS